MKQNGKVLFFNANDGNGIIINSNKEKIDFSVRDWNDFDVMPVLGLEVKFFYEDGTISDITALQSPDDEATPTEYESPQSLLDESIAENIKNAEESAAETEISEPQDNTPDIILENSQDQDTHQDDETTMVEENAQLQTNIEDEITQTDKDISTDDVQDGETQTEQKLEEENSEDETASSEEENEDTSSAKVAQEEATANDTQESLEEGEEHFSTEEAINLIEGGIEDLQEEIGEQRNSLTLTLNIHNAVANYFDIIKHNVDKRKNYLTLEGRLDYLTIRRFLWTTYNNVSEIDLHIITPKIKTLADDLKAMAKVYDDFIIKTKHPKLAYEEVFLSCQKEYMYIRDAAEKTIQRLSQLQNSEKHLGGVLKVKKADLQKQIDTEEFDILKEELKSLNGAYVDVVHMMAELDERYKSDMKLLIEFEAEYKKDFTDLFAESAVKYKRVIVDILSAQAFLLDAKLWAQAKTSKAVAAHFHKAGITGELNTKTYLKYYLDTQDSAKAKGETQKLFQLYDYLCAAEKDFIMVVVNDMNDAMEYEQTIKKLDKKYEVKAFLDEKKALKWAMQNSVKAVIVEDRLTKMSAEAFLKFYKKYIVVNPKIITLGTVRKAEDYVITKMLPKGISSRALGLEVQGALDSK